MASEIIGNEIENEKIAIMTGREEESGVSLHQICKDNPVICSMLEETFFGKDFADMKYAFKHERYTTGEEMCLHYMDFWDIDYDERKHTGQWQELCNLSNLSDDEAILLCEVLEKVELNGGKSLESNYEVLYALGFFQSVEDVESKNSKNKSDKFSDKSSNFGAA